jgi:hypothetical protein
MKRIILSIISLFVAFFVLNVYAAPPGLSGKGGADFPHGLEKGEKTPHGWSQGRKEGWDNDFRHHHHHHHHHYDNDFDNR